MKHLPLLSALLLAASSLSAQQPAAPVFERPLRDLNKDYFPMLTDGVMTPEAWPARRDAIRQRILLACGLLPLPQKTPLNPQSHGRIEREDYLVDRIVFESFPGHYVSGNLYLPKAKPKNGKLPVVLCPHGHWPNGRLMDLGAGSAATNQELAIGAERFENAARSPLQARCIQLARMGCAVLFYDMLGYADSVQIADHRAGKRPALCGTEPGSYGFYSPMADLRLQSNFGLQTWNSIRALDYLLSLPGADPQRVGCTGASGGGTQTMILSAIDDRITAAFPCVMVSTAMQGGCTCENACYLRIGQGNIDIAAATAPRPLGMTAADDWTKELQTKGYPDLQALYKVLGAEKNLSATFNTHFKHNYNHVSRVAMYGFMSQHLGLDYQAPVLEKDFIFTPAEELSVWNKKYPKPAGENTGDAHELALLKLWAADSDAAMAPLLAPKDAAAAEQSRQVIGAAWDMILDRKLAGEGHTQIEAKKQDRESYITAIGTVRHTLAEEDVKVEFIAPRGDQWNGSAVIWLSPSGAADLGGLAGPLSEPAQKMLQAGMALVIPSLYQQGAEKAPRLTVKERDPQKPDTNSWQHAACYTYGYNPTLLAQRARDVLTTIALVQHHPEKKAKKIYLVGTGSYGVIAAAAATQARDVLAGVVADTGGFRFASLTDQYEPHFVPGAVKYGDTPGLLGQIAPCTLKVLGEKTLSGVQAAYTALKGSVQFSEATGSSAAAAALLELAQ
jgi:dienelactone hydrolase